MYNLAEYQTKVAHGTYSNESQQKIEPVALDIGKLICRIEETRIIGKKS